MEKTCATPQRNWSWSVHSGKKRAWMIIQKTKTYGKSQVVTHSQHSQDAFHMPYAPYTPYTHCTPFCLFHPDIIGISAPNIDSHVFQQFNRHLMFTMWQTQ